jgi:hypothetical protein
MLYVMEASVQNSGQPRITLRMIFEHMLAMDQRLTHRIDGLSTDIKRVERKVDIALVQIGNIDERLDHLEVVELPKIRKAVGIR